MSENSLKYATDDAVGAALTLLAEMDFDVAATCNLIGVVADLGRVGYEIVKGRYSPLPFEPADHKTPAPPPAAPDMDPEQPF